MKFNRRGWVVSVAATAAAAGVGWSIWRQRATDSSVDEAFWRSSFETPDGSRLVLAELRDQPLVLNFWAPWCPPCVREMPALDRFAREFAPRGWRVIGLAVDKAQPVRDFLARSPVSYAIGLTGFEGIELSRQLGNLSGGLPFTVLFGRHGALLQRHMGETTYDQLAQWAQDIA